MGRFNPSITPLDRASYASPLPSPPPSPNFPTSPLGAGRDLNFETPTIHLSLPDPTSFDLILHFLYWGDASVVEDALDRGICSWEGMVDNLRVSSGARSFIEKSCRVISLREIRLDHSLNASVPSSFSLHRFSISDLLSRRSSGSGGSGITLPRRSAIPRRLEEVDCPHLPIWTRTRKPEGGETSVVSLRPSPLHSFAFTLRILAHYLLVLSFPCFDTFAFSSSRLAYTHELSRTNPYDSRWLSAFFSSSLFPPPQLEK